MNRSSITEHLRFLELGLDAAPAAPESFEFGGGKYTIRVANDLESRRKAYELVYRLYLEKEYAQPHPSKMWLSIFDALPETTTLLVEKQAEGLGLKAEGTTALLPPATPAVPSARTVPVGALTVVFDSPMGLPADGLYQPELDALRAAGRKLSEIISLGVAEEAQAGSEILVKLFNFAYMVARRVRGATDFVITVNPRHVAFYRRKFYFQEAGPERNYGKVGGAPAVLLAIPLNTPDRVTGPERERTIYRFWLSENDEPQVVVRLRRTLRAMTGPELGYFFIAETDLLAQATPGQRAHIQERCPACEPDAVPLGSGHR